MRRRAPRSSSSSPRPPRCTLRPVCSADKRRRRSRSRSPSRSTAAVSTSAGRTTAAGSVGVGSIASNSWPACVAPPVEGSFGRNDTKIVAAIRTDSRRSRPRSAADSAAR